MPLRRTCPRAPNPPRARLQLDQPVERGAASRPAPRAPPSASLLRGARLLLPTYRGYARRRPEARLSRIRHAGSLDTPNLHKSSRSLCALSAQSQLTHLTQLAILSRLTGLRPPRAAKGRRSGVSATLLRNRGHARAGTRTQFTAVLYTPNFRHPDRARLPLRGRHCSRQAPCSA